MARARKGAVVLESAGRLFLERGFAGTSMDDIAGAAGVSKATVYSNFRDKETLLIALLEQVTDEAAGILAVTLEPLTEGGPLQQRLDEAASALVEGVLRPSVVQLRRLAIAEAARLPVAGRVYWERAPDATISLLAQAFSRMNDAGELDIGDPRAAAEAFAYALLGPLQDRALLAPERLPPAAERAEHARSVVRRFLLATNRRPGDGGPPGVKG